VEGGRAAIQRVFSYTGITLYSRDHTWIRMEDEFTGACGITDQAQEILSFASFVDLPETEQEVRVGEECALVESHRDIFRFRVPAAGRITEVNEALIENPELINSDPYGDGWIIKVEVKFLSELQDLMDEEGYRDFVELGG
jgi:glycine cleavage system H protein